VTFNNLETCRTDTYRDPAERTKKKKDNRLQKHTWRRR